MKFFFYLISKNETNHHESMSLNRTLKIRKEISFFSNLGYYKNMNDKYNDKVSYII
jgi:hypothetical protein